MDFPDFEELQWLESHTAEDPLEEDCELQMEPPSPTLSTELDESPKRPMLILPPRPSLSKPCTQTVSTVKKRILSDDPNYCDLDPYNSGEKRCKTGELDDPFLVKDERTEDIIPEILSNENIDIEINDGLNEENIVEEEKEGEERMLSRFASELDGDCVPVTGMDGEMVFAKICTFQMDEEQRRKKTYATKGLLVESVRVLMQKMENEVFTRAVQASVEGQSGIDTQNSPDGNQQLWVEKYAPSSFTELLSDEKTNREVLLWLKQWDFCVFGSAIKSTTDDVLSALSRHSMGAMHVRKSGKYTNFGNRRETGFTGNLRKGHYEFDEEVNATLGTQEIMENRNNSPSPPEQKILLLCGPPGLGKTTLAHVAARHCGYHVVEINASDDRSASVIETKILDVVQMNSVVAGSKPKCLVIDEIDGALGDGKGAIEIILKLLSAEKKKSSSKENLDQESKSKRKDFSKNQRNSPLLRPVICICNDLYAPALRPLREVAKVHIFVQPSVNRVVNRLKYICNREKVKMSSVSLSALANFTGCDIRSCLNTLQFLNNKKEVLNVLDLGSQVVGLKDASKSAFDIWKEIFQRRKAKWIKRSTNPGSCSTENFEFLHSMISNHGDYDLILDGIHENMLKLHYVDPVMEKTVRCLNNLVVSDIVHQYVMRTHKMYLQVYQPPIALLIRGLIARPEKNVIRWPKSFYSFRTALADRMNTVQTWNNRIAPSISRHLSTKSVIEDSVSLFLHILSPLKIRLVAPNLLSEPEKKDLWQLVNIMVSYAVTYRNNTKLSHEEASESNYLSIDPPLFDFIRFKGYNLCHCDVSSAVKQVLLHEVEKQRILQGSLSKSIDLSLSENKSISTETRGKNPTEDNSGMHMFSISKLRSLPSNVPATGIKSSSERTKRASGVLTDFFQRSKKSNKNNKEEGGSSPDALVQGSKTVQYPLLFKFNEGFTNAVKRPVRLREFLYLDKGTG